MSSLSVLNIKPALNFLRLNDKLSYPSVDPLRSFWWENCKFTSNSGGVISRLKILYVYNNTIMIATSPFIWPQLICDLALHVRGIYFYIYVLSVVDAANEERYE